VASGAGQGERVTFACVFETVQGRAAFILPGPCAFGDQLHEIAFEVSQFIELAAHLREFVFGELPGVRAGTGACHLQQTCDLVQAEAHRLRMSDEPESSQVGVAVTPDTTRRPGWFGQKAAALVITHGLDMDTGCDRQPANRESAGHA
jgi:hypothetical protein